MKNINYQTKKFILVASGIAISILLILMINSKLNEKPISEAIPEKIESKEIDIVIDIPEEEKVKEDVVLEQIQIDLDENKDNGAVDKKANQKIQDDIPPKPTYTEEQLTNPEQKPNGEKVEPPTKESAEKNNAKVKEPKKETKIEGGETKDGQIYLPGFGWVKDEGGGGEGIIAEDMYENGNKIGEMD